MAQSSSSAQPVGIGWSSAALAIFVSILWGGNIVSLKIALATVPPFWCAFWRMVLGAAVLSAWALSRGVPLRPLKGEGRGLFGLGMLFAVQIALMNEGALMTSPAFGEVIINSYAIFANVVAHFAMNERLNGSRALGLALAFAGLCLVAFSRPDSALAPKPLEGNLVMILSSILLGIRQVYTRWLVQGTHPARAVVWMLLWSIPAFLLGSLVTGEPLLLRELTWRPVAAIAYQGVVVAGVCFVGWAWLLRKHPAGSISMFSFLVPFAGIAFSMALLGEPLRKGLLMGAALAVGGLLLVAFSGRSVTRDRPAGTAVRSSSR